MERQPQSGGGSRPKLGPGWQSLGQSSGTHLLRARLNEFGECLVYSLCDFSLGAFAATFSSQILLLAPFVCSGSAHQVHVPFIWIVASMQVNFPVDNLVGRPVDNVVGSSTGLRSRPVTEGKVGSPNNSPGWTSSFSTNSAICPSLKPEGSSYSTLSVASTSAPQFTYCPGVTSTCASAYARSSSVFAVSIVKPAHAVHRVAGIDDQIENGTLELMHIYDRAPETSA